MRIRGTVLVFSVLCVLVHVMSLMAQAPELKNGDMSEGGDTPAGWTLKIDEGDMRLVRDTADFASAPTSLRLESVGGVAKGNASQAIKVKAGDTFAVSGKVRAEGNIQYSAVVLLAIGGNPAWNPLATFSTASNWDSFTSRITVPQGTSSALLMVFMHGDGKVWADDLKIAEAENVKASPLLEEFNRGPDFAYGDFQGNASVAKGGALHINAKAGRGAAARNADLDLSSMSHLSPVMSARVGPGNRARIIRLFFQDTDKNRRTFSYSLEGVSSEKFEMLTPQDGGKLADPEGKFDLSKINMFQVQGAWNNDPVEVFIDSIKLVEPSAAILAARGAAEERLANASKAEAEAAKKRAHEVKRIIAEGAKRSPDGPEVVEVSAVAPYILALGIQDRNVVRRTQEPYVQMDGDEIRHSGKDNLPIWDSTGKLVLGSKNMVLWRNVDGQFRQYAWYVETPDGSFTWREDIEGTALDTNTVDVPAAYAVSSEDDAAFGAAGIAPVAVHRKSKPNDQQQAPGATNSRSYRHVIYLVLPSPLSEGKTYSVGMRGVNTRQASVDYVHDSRKNVSEAIHTTHIGYRPDDSFKRAYLSVWLGTGGAHEYKGIDSFELINADSGKAVYQGKITLGFPADQPEQMRVVRNHNKTNVYYLDFHEFNTPGNYRVRIPGIGVSLPFDIGRDVWTKAFRTSMHGLLSHRSGIELGAPFSEYRRPRNMHPVDGFKVFDMKHTRIEGEADTVLKEFSERLGNPPDVSRLGKPDPNAWGGYMDAGDWDRRSQHLYVSHLLLELFELFPEHFSEVEIALPPGEAKNGLPGILNEALFNIDCYGRLQLPDGGVRGGIESTEHPRPAEASWQETLLVGAFAPDPISSYAYASSAARAARLLKGLDDARAAKLADGAVKAWQWAEANAEKVFGEITKRAPKLDMAKVRNENDGDRLLALVELARLTGSQDYALKLKDAMDKINRNDISSRSHLPALLSCAIDKQGIIDDDTRETAKSIIVHYADVAIKFAEGNAFSIHNRVPGVPMMGYLCYYSVPEMNIGPVLPRAYVLTGDQRYLDAAVAAANFSAGANPDNMTYVVGVGHNYPRSVLHMDSRVTGQPPPAGTGVYGPGDLAADWGFYNWVHQWHLTGMVPDSRSWPASESYVDLYLWPAMTEYTVQQNMGPTSYFWGFLSAR